jgi:hypothetical protein
MGYVLSMECFILRHEEEFCSQVEFLEETIGSFEQIVVKDLDFYLLVFYF